MFLRTLLSRRLTLFIVFFFPFFFFFFKQKTAYEIMPSLVGSEMCIRDSQLHALLVAVGQRFHFGVAPVGQLQALEPGVGLLYTSDAADDLLCVDLGGR